VKHSGAWPRWPQLGPLAADRGSHLLGLSLSGGEVHHQDHLYLECRLTPRWHMRRNHGSDLLAGELASSWHCLLLGGELPSTSLRLLPSVMRVMSFEREAGFRPRCHCSRGNCQRGLSGWSVIHPWCGCDGSGRSPRAPPSGRWEAEAPLPA
jgi:hypothetical protein